MTTVFPCIRLYPRCIETLLVEGFVPTPEKPYRSSWRWKSTRCMETLLVEDFAPTPKLLYNS